MKNIMNILRPSSLKYRLFVAFIFFIFIPYFTIQIRNFSQIEKLYERQISVQNQDQLQQVASRFETLKGTVFRTAIQLEKEPDVIRLLKAGKPEGPAADMPPSDNRVEALFQEIRSKFLPDSNYVYYTIADMQGNLYTSYQLADQEHYHAFMHQEGVQQVLNGGTQASYTWAEGPIEDITGAPNRMLSFYMTIRDSGREAVGLVRISIDYQEWLRSLVSRFLIQQDYVLLDEAGSIIGRSRPNVSLPPDVIELLDSSLVPGSYVVDRSSSSLLNVAYIPSLNWYVIGQFPLEIFFGDIQQIKRQFFMSLLLPTLVFVAMTFLIASSVTKPLRLLQKRMSEITGKNFKLIGVDRYKGEVLHLANAFNQMLEDMNKMVERLKAEERQKEAMRFQVLLSQMNPHFLLNTINTIKWNALSHDDESTAEICVSLGRLLETSLNTNVELIHLKDELELVNAYVYIQNVRYDHRFEVTYEYDAAALQYALVPKFTLQPIVENSIIHGISQMKVGGRVEVRIWADGVRLVVEVKDNGIGLERAAKLTQRRRHAGVGLKNLKERLALLFKDSASLELQPLEQGTLARIVMPLLLSPPYQDQTIARGDNHVEGLAGRG